MKVAIAGLIGYAAVVYFLLSSTPLRWLDALFSPRSSNFFLFSLLSKSIWLVIWPWNVFRRM